jgi:hypothetical protein
MYTIEDVGEGAWLLSQEGRRTPIWLHEVLVSERAVAIRWFSRDEWNMRATGRELPY